MKKWNALTVSLFLILFAGCNSRPAPPVNEGYLDGADNARLYYRVMGAHPDTLVIVQGGPGAEMHSILPAIAPLSRQYTLIFYDQRGGGKSSLPADSSKLQAHYFVEDLEAVRKFFGLRRMNLITHSFGAVLAARYAGQYPQYLNRLVFHGATGPQRAEVAKMYQAKAAAVADTALAKKSHTLLLKLLKGTAADPVAACLEYEAIHRKIAAAGGETYDERCTTCNASPEAVRYYYQYTAQLTPASFGNWDFTNGLGKLAAPLLVVYGRKDTLAIPQQSAWAKAAPNGRLLLVPDAWKGAFSDNPDFVFTAIDTFFQGDWPNAAQVVK